MTKIEKIAFDELMAPNECLTLAGDELKALRRLFVNVCVAYEGACETIRIQQSTIEKLTGRVVEK